MSAGDKESLDDVHLLRHRLHQKPSHMIHMEQSCDSHMTLVRLKTYSISTHGCYFFEFFEDAGHCQFRRCEHGLLHAATGLRH